MKIKMFCIFMIIILLINYIPLINASWTVKSSTILVENIASDSDHPVLTSNNNAQFYYESEDRFYIFYTYDASSYDYLIRYSYTDSGDYETWNNGGSVTGVGYIRQTSISGNTPANMYAVVYDEENSIGHLVYSKDYSTASNGLYYLNFTIDVGGSLTFGSIRTIWNFGAGTNFGTVDIALSHSNLPIIGFAGLVSSTYHDCGIISDSIDMYSGSLTWVEYRHIWNGGISVIPTGNTSCLLITGSGSGADILRSYEIDFLTPTANSTGTGTAFSDNTVTRYDYQNGADMVFFSTTYNTTHGFVHYSSQNNYGSYFFSFDFETLTRSSEVEVMQDGVINVYTMGNGLSLHNNEPFSAFTKRNTAGCRGSEYHNSSYEGYFNSSTIQTINTDFNYQEYNGLCLNYLRHANEDGYSIIMGTKNGYVAVVVVQLDGEYPTPEAEEEEEETNVYGYYVDSTGWFLIAGFLSLIAIFVFAFKIKNESRRN